MLSTQVSKPQQGRECWKKTNKSFISLNHKSQDSFAETKLKISQSKKITYVQQKIAYLAVINIK